MAAPISRSPEPRVISSSLESINTGILEAAQSQPLESIDQAIRSFDWVSGQDRQISTGPADTSTRPGYVDDPAEYLSFAAEKGASLGEIVSMEQVIAGLRSGASQFRQGVNSFLQSGIQEALASMKLRLGGKHAAPEILESLNDLLSPDQIKTLDASRLKPSMDAVNDMYATLKKVQSASNDLQMNMMRMIRA